MTTALQSVFFPAAENCRVGGGGGGGDRDGDETESGRARGTHGDTARERLKMEDDKKKKLFTIA